MAKAHIISDHKKQIIQDGCYNAGYSVVSYNQSPSPDDILVTWNRRPKDSALISKYESCGARIVVVENGYIGKDDSGHKLLSLALTNHLGLGKWYIGEERRWVSHNIHIAPWKSTGKHIVLLAQRGIGNSKDQRWYNDLAEKLRAKTDRKIIVRPHPGAIKAKHNSSLYSDIDDAHCVITWSSAAGLNAMAYGIPCFHMLKGWIGEPASKYGIDDLENPIYPDREDIMHRIGWAQWTIEEMRSGMPFKKLELI